MVKGKGEIRQNADTNLSRKMTFTPLPEDEVLVVRAGRRALERIRAHGLDPADVEIIPGAAGGPKGLGIAGLDEAVFGTWLPRAPRVRHLVGASVGAWRFAAACRGDAVTGLRDLAREYSGQKYPLRPSRRFITDYAREMLATLFAGREREILENEHYRLHVLAVRGRGALARDGNLRTPLGFGMAAIANAVGRRHLAHFMERTIFHDARGQPPFIAPAHLSATDPSKSIRFDAFHTHTVALDAGNLREALMASASIPLVLDGVADVPRAPAGVYWDGGIIDYHLHLPYHHAQGLVLYPHFTDRIVPGWLDKALPWRKARGAWLDNVVLVAPSRAYLARLPHGKLPDRKDFVRYENDYDGRLKYWRAAIAESARLGDAFLEFARAPDPAKVQPL